MSRRLSALFMVSLLALSGCATSSTEETVAVAPVATDVAKTPEGLCQEAVATTANRPIGDTSVLSVESSRAGAGVKIKLKGADRPWSCIVDAKGTVTNVMYMGEG